MDIEIFGTGCENCKRLEKNAIRAVNELCLEAKIIKVTDFEAFIRRGIKATPGLAIDGEVVSMGRVPNVEEIREILEGKRTEFQPASGGEIALFKPPSCGCSTTGTMIFPCSGGSNVGQISNEAAKVLAMKGWGEFSCLAGIGAHSNNFITSAKRANKIVVIDGCAAKCALKTLRGAGIEPHVHAIVAEMAIKKDYGQLDPKAEDVEKVVCQVEKAIRTEI